MAADPLATRLDGRYLALYGESDPFRYPRTYDEWQSRYQFLIDAYHGETYSQQLIKQLQLFRALDNDGKIIALTRRVHRDRQHIVDVGTSALAATELSINPTEGADQADVERAMAIWKRSKPKSNGAMWAKTLVTCGDLHLEVARVDPGSDDVTIVSHPPMNVYLEYDAAIGIRLQRAIVRSEVIGEAKVDFEGGVIESGETYIHQRTLTPAEVRVEARYQKGEEGQRQRQLDEEASGPHPLKSPPFVHIRCEVTPQEPEHGLPVTHGLDRAEAEINSTMAQMSAAGDRFANPKPYLFGAKLGDDSAISRFGRWLNIYGSGSDKVKAGYMETNLSGLKALLEGMERLIRDIRLTFPEFLFVGGGSTANLSGDALRLLSTLYVAKYQAIRSRFYAGLEEALAKAVALEKGEAYDPEYHPVVIEGPALLPADLKSELEALTLAKGLGGITSLDVVRRVQALGIANDELPAEEYLELLMEEEMGRVSDLLGEEDDDDPTEEAPLPTRED